MQYLRRIEYIRAGKLRALAVTTATRSEVLPDIPTVGEFVPGYEASAWYGVGAPRTRPPRSSKAQQGDQCGPRRPQDEGAACGLGPSSVPLALPTSNIIADETEKWAKVIRAANIKPE